MIFQDESGDMNMELPCSCDAELDCEIVGNALSSPLFIQERKKPANLRQVYHSYEESLCQLSPFFTHTQERGNLYTNKVRVKNKSQVSTWKK